jgi:hypothetical protein
MALEKNFFDNAAAIALYALTSDTGGAAWITWRVGLTYDETAAYSFVATHSAWTTIGNSRLDAAAGAGGLTGGYTVPSADSWTLNLTRTTDTISATFATAPNWATVDTTASGNIDGCCIIANCDIGAGATDYLWSWHRPTSVLAMNGSNVDLSWASDIPWDLELPNT